ncbi:MAG: hypothetical protein IJA58_01640 [Lachnospiraceae bacterium]|nr:hypothetical protein [Lachnospiraceae bacterium]
MLKKLLKYDLKANLKVYLLMYAMLITTAVMTRINYLDWMSENKTVSVLSDIASVFLTFAFWIALVAVNVICIVLIVQRFYKHLFGSEGYLTFTLPVSAEQLFFSKVISAVLIYLSCVVVQIVSIVILSIGTFEDTNLSGDVGYIEDIVIDLMPTGEMIAQAVLYLGGMLAALLMVYFSICVGQMVNRHRVISAILVYFGLNTISGTISSTLRDGFVNISYNLFDIQINFDVAYYIFAGLLLLIELVGYSYGSILIMKKKLNLE